MKCPTCASPPPPTDDDVDFVDEVIAEPGPGFAAKVDAAVARRRTDDDVEAVVRRLHDAGPCRTSAGVVLAHGRGVVCEREQELRAAVLAGRASRGAEVDDDPDYFAREAPGGGYSARDWRSAYATQAVEVSQLRARVELAEGIAQIATERGSSPEDLERIASLESQLAASQAALREARDVLWHCHTRAVSPVTHATTHGRARRCVAIIDAALQALPERPAGGE